jgi:polysaccharide biosynthesis protein PslH
VKILWVKAGKLLPLDSGGRIRSYQILRHLVRDHDVKLLSYYGGQRDADYERKIEREFPGACVIFTAALDGAWFLQSLDYLRLLFRATPFSVSKFTDPNVQCVLSRWILQGDVDVSVCDFLSASPNFPSDFYAPTVLFQHNVETSLWERMAATEPNPAKRLIYRMEAIKMARYEHKALRRFQHVIAVSDHDRRQMLRMEPSCQIAVIPTGVDVARYAAAPHASSNPLRIVFTGSMDWEPNVDAVIHFCQSTLPRIRQALPDARFQIVGRNPHSRVTRLASEWVQVTGTVPSVADYLYEATVVVVPLRIGGGTRLKIFEAMAMGKAIVSTTIGAEGLDVQSGRDLILADDAVAFADAVILLAQNGTIRRQYELAARHVAVQHDWSEVTRIFADALGKVCRKPSASEMAIPQRAL